MKTMKMKMMNRILRSEKNFGFMPSTVVTLHTGENVPCYDERWRHECEAKNLLKMPLASRREQLSRIEKFSQERADKLRETMKVLFDKQKR